VRRDSSSGVVTPQQVPRQVVEEARRMNEPLSREAPAIADRTALLIIDVQKYCAMPDGSEFAGRDMGPYEHFFERLENQVLPNIQALQACFRDGGWEIVFTMIESLTRDGRDRSLDYKISGLHVAKGSRDAEMVDAICPQGDEIVIPKTSSSVFNSTNIDYVLRNLGIDYLVVAGVVTDQCVESAVRDAADKGYLVTLVKDACCTYTQEHHDNALNAIKGYCRIRSTREIVDELRRQLSKAG
jgi:ureidoacrylate peracid hydrolase